MIPRTSGDATSRDNHRVRRPEVVPKSSGYGRGGVGGGVGSGGAPGWGLGGGATEERDGGPESVGSDTASAASDINYMHESLRQYHPEDDEEGVSTEYEMCFGLFSYVDGFVCYCTYLM